MAVVEEEVPQEVSTEVATEVAPLSGVRARADMVSRHPAEGSRTGARAAVADLDTAHPMAEVAAVVETSVVAPK